MRRMLLPVSLGEGVRLPWATGISKDIEARHRTQALKDDVDPTQDVCACEFQDAFRENLESEPEANCQSLQLSMRSPLAERGCHSAATTGWALTARWRLPTPFGAVWFVRFCLRPTAGRDRRTSVLETRACTSIGINC